MKASDLLNSSCPIRPHFLAWCRGKGTEPTKRQASKFLQAFPRYTQAKAA